MSARSTLARGIAALAVLLAADQAFAQTPAPGAPNKVLRYAFESAETGFDPVQIQDGYSLNVARMIFDAPFAYAYLGKPGTRILATASEQPTISSDSRTFTIHIKPGIYFADDPAFDGKKRELVAADYLYTLKRIADPRWKSPNWSGLEDSKITGLNAAHDAAIRSGRFDYDAPIEGLRLIDRYTYQIHTDRPNPRFEAMTESARYGAMAREVVERYGDDIMSHPVGTGPFRIVEWRRSTFIALERNANFREEIFDNEADPDDADAVQLAARLKGKRLPFLDRIEISIIPEQQPRWLAFLNGEQDLMYEVPRLLAPLAVPNGKLSPTLQALNVRMERVPSIDVTFLVFNVEDPVVGGYTPAQVALRRAISMAFDAPELIRAMYKGQAFLAQTGIAPRTYGYDPNLTTELGNVNPARANAMLDAYGFIDRDGDGYRERPDGSPLTLLYSTQPEQTYRVQDEIFKRSMDRIHLRVDFRTAQWAEQLRMARNGKFQLWALASSATAPDGASVFSYTFGPEIGGYNLSRFRNDRFDELFRQQDAMADSPERLAIIREMNAIQAAYVPMHYIAHRYSIDLTYPWVLNYRHWPFVLSNFVRYVDIDTELERTLARH